MKVAYTLSTAMAVALAGVAVGLAANAVAGAKTSGYRLEVEGRTYYAVYVTVKRFQRTLLESIDDLNEKTCVNHLGNYNVPMYTKKGYTEIERENHQGTGQCSGKIGTYTQLYYTWTEGCLETDRFRAVYTGNGKRRFKFVITCSEAR